VSPVSCIYEGTVRHRRLAPVEHRFRYRLFLCFLDLDELPGLLRGRWLVSATRPAPLRFRREDHLGDTARPLAECVRDAVAERIGHRPQGPVRLLTHLRHLGFVFNPVSFYYCYAPDGESLEASLAEVDNTPWGERHLYAVDARPAPGRGPRRAWRVAKEFHVSPFMPMDLDYAWRFSEPGERLSVEMANVRGGERLFEASLSLSRRPFDTRSLLSALLRFPLLTARLLAAIYLQALRLWWKRAPYHPHPGPRTARVPVEET